MLVELGAVIQRRFGVEVLKSVHQTVSSSFEVVWVDESLHQRAWDRLLSHGRKGPSLVDWTGFLIAGDSGIKKVMAVDHHFADRGFELLPAPTRQAPAGE